MSYRVRFTTPNWRTGYWMRDYATREDAQRAIDERQEETGLAYAVEEVAETAAVPDATPDKTASQWPYWTASTPHPATPEARIRELEAKLAQLRDAYDAAKRSVARLEGTLAMVQASWAASVASEDAWRARSRQHLMDAASCRVRLERAIELGDAMYLALTTAQPYLAGRVAMGEWEAYKHTLAASRQGPAKASEAPGEGQDSGEGEK